jgi:esterase/lipase
MNKKIKIYLALLLLVPAAWFLIGYFSAWYMVSRRSAPFSILTNKLNYQNIKLVSDDSISISAWYINGELNKAVIILAGIGADRRSCIARAEYYIKKGYHVLLPDLRGTGSSGGETITFGWRESKDLKSCYEFLKNKKIEKIGVHGCSLGAATITYSLQEFPDYYFIVLESCYDNIDQAFENRVVKYHLPDFVYFPVRFFVQRRMGVSTESLKPEEFIKLTHSPVLIMAGDCELQVKIPETKKLFNNCSGPTKMLYFFKNGKHEDFMDKYPTEYIKIINRFMQII